MSELSATFRPHTALLLLLLQLGAGMHALWLTRAEDISCIQASCGENHKDSSFNPDAQAWWMILINQGSSNKGYGTLTKVWTGFIIVRNFPVKETSERNTMHLSKRQLISASQFVHYAAWGTCMHSCLSAFILTFKVIPFIANNASFFVFTLQKRCRFVAVVLHHWLCGKHQRHQWYVHKCPRTHHFSEGKQRASFCKHAAVIHHNTMVESQKKRLFKSHWRMCSFSYEIVVVHGWRLRIIEVCWTNGHRKSKTKHLCFDAKSRSKCPEHGLRPR